MISNILADCFAVSFVDNTFIQNTVIKCDLQLVFFFKIQLIFVRMNPVL